MSMSQLQKNDLPWHFFKHLQGGQEFQPPRLMAGINQDNHFLLIETVKETTSQNQLT